MKEIINKQVYGSGAYNASKVPQNESQWDLINILLAIFAFGLLVVLIWVRLG